MNLRDDFDRVTKENLARRVSYRCSNPKCQKPTSGPQSNSGKAINIGVAAHITAASPGGRRYDPKLSSAERRSIDNGIWLCQNHAKLIDSDEKRYSVKLLREWKSKAEQQTLIELEDPLSSQKSSSGGIDRAQSTRQRDLGTLRLLFENLNTRTMDNFFLDGQTGFICHDVLFYDDIIREIVNASSFHIYDKALERKLRRFYTAWQASLNYDNDFFMGPNLWVSKFVVESKSSAESFKRFVRDLRTAEKAYREFVKFVKDTYIELDITETDRVARKAFLEYKADVDSYISNRKGKNKTAAKKKKRG